ncbi:MAG: S-methyl-5-thioribose-1-phosphate isomerase [Chloroflexota bacterium]|nr:S-methyl-5-thioribose-1-phosphate isomerase [Chloroflexota bacterium]
MSAIEWADGRLCLLDQTRLPSECVTLALDDYRQVARAIVEMRVRGAPALGVAAAYAVAMAARAIEASNREGYLAALERAAGEVVAARPTAVNMAWAARQLLAIARAEQDWRAIPERLLAEAQAIQRRDVEANRSIGRHGAALIPDGATVLTHCNTGALATAGYGTALGVIRAAWEQGKRIKVIADETRPFLQGARLTAWELAQLGIPTTLIVDSAAGALMRRGEVTCAIVGADRIVANGDTANKIGTYSVAVLARENHVPFYVAAPTSTVDLSIESGDGIPIEERRSDEVTRFAGVQTAPEGVAVRNPSFDVTPARYISAIITEHGVALKPYRASLRRLARGRE